MFESGSEIESQFLNKIGADIYKHLRNSHIPVTGYGYYLSSLGHSIIQ